MWVCVYCGFGCYYKIEVEDDVMVYVEFVNGVMGFFVILMGELLGIN